MRPRLWFLGLGLAMSLAGCGGFQGGAAEPPAAAVLANPAQAAGNFDRLPAPIRTYLSDLGRDAGVTAEQQARMVAIAHQYEAPAPMPSPAIDFRALFLAPQVDQSALRAFFSVDGTSSRAGRESGADMMAALRDVLTAPQRERVAAYLLSHQEPLGIPIAASPAPSAAAEMFDQMLASLLVGVSLRPEQQQRVDALKTALSKGKPTVPGDFYLQKIVAFVRDGDRKAYLAEPPGAGMGLPTTELVEATACLDRDQRVQVAANFDRLSAMVPQR